MVHLKVASALLAVCLPLASSFTTPSVSSSAVTNNFLRTTQPSLPSPLVVSTTTPKTWSPYAKNNHVVYMTSDAAAASDEGEESSADSNDGDATVTQLIFNLVKGIVEFG